MKESNIFIGICKKIIWRILPVLITLISAVCSRAHKYIFSKARNALTERGSADSFGVEYRQRCVESSHIGEWSEPDISKSSGRTWEFSTAEELQISIASLMFKSAL